MTREAMGKQEMGGITRQWGGTFHACENLDGSGGKLPSRQVTRWTELNSGSKGLSFLSREAHRSNLSVLSQRMGRGGSLTLSKKIQQDLSPGIAQGNRLAWIKMAESVMSLKTKADGTKP